MNNIIKVFLSITCCLSLVPTAIFAADNPVTVQSGASYTFTCGLSVGSNEVLSWFRIYRNDSVSELKISDGANIACCLTEPKDKFVIGGAGRTLTMNYIYGWDEAFYFCRKNYRQAGEVTDTTRYVVTVQALISDANMDVYYTNGTKGYYVNGEDVVITCTVFDVKPEPDIVWVKLRSPDSDSFDVIKTGVELGNAIPNDNYYFNKTAKLTISASRDLLFNVLRCRAYQNVSEKIYQTAIDTTPIVINVRIDPVCSTVKVNKFAATNPGHAMATCYVDANPLPSVAPTCNWYTLATTTSELLATTTATIDTSSYWYYSSFNYSVTRTTDYRTIYCTCQTISTSLYCPAYIVQPGLPDPVSNCRQSDTTSYSMKIICDEGFSGGSQQYFALDQMAKGQDSTISRVSFRVASGYTTPSFSLNTLTSSTVYQFRVCSSNNAFPDMQQCTKLFSVATVSGPSAIIATSGVQLWIILAACGGGLLLIIVIMVIVFVVLKKGKDPDEPEPRPNPPPNDIEMATANPTISAPILENPPPIETEHFPRAGDGHLLAAAVVGAAVYAMANEANRSNESLANSSVPEPEPEVEIPPPPTVPPPEDPEPEPFVLPEGATLAIIHEQGIPGEPEPEPMPEPLPETLPEPMPEPTPEPEPEYGNDDSTELHIHHRRHHLGDGHLLRVGAAVAIGAAVAAHAIADAAEERREAEANEHQEHSGES